MALMKAKADTPTPTPTLDQQLDAARVYVEKLTARQSEIAAMIVGKRNELQGLAVPAASGDETATKRMKNLRAAIAEIESDAETVTIALAHVTDLANELSSALNAQIVAEQNASAAAAVEQLLAQICEADAAFFSAIRTTAAAFGTLRQYRDRLRAGELSQACSATRALERLSAAHDKELEATLRALGGPSIVTADVDAAWRLSRAAAVWTQALLTEWLPLLQKGAL